MLKYTLSILLIAFFIAAAVFQGTHKPHKQQINTAQQPSENVHTLEKIDFISHVKQTVQNLGESPHIMTIHHESGNKSHAMKKEVTVKFKQHPNQQELAKILTKIDGKMKKHSDPYCIFRSKTKSTEELITYFSSRKDVEFSEPNFLLLPNLLPNDPLYTRYQWNLPAIKANLAWNISEGSPGIVIAVVDTGVDLTHEEFRNKLVSGYNVLLDNNRPMDDNGHGTHVSGIIAANTNNTLGIAGISWNNKIMPVKAIGAEGTGSSFDIAKGIRWAADHGARVINMSVGNYHPSTVLQEAIQYAYSKGVLMVAASGNDNTSQPSYPAAYPEVLSIAAVDSQENRAQFSNYGDYVDVAAPGVQIPSTYIYNEYAALSGTSMACPHVAGLAGLILSVNPQLTNKEVASIIQQSATDLGQPGKDAQYGYGLININRALQMAFNQKVMSVPPQNVQNTTHTFFSKPLRTIAEWFGFK